MILDREVEMRWLDPDLENGQAALSYLRLVPPDLFETFPVSSLVSSPRNQGPALIEPAEERPPARPASSSTPTDALGPQTPSSGLPSRRHAPCESCPRWPTVSSRP